MRHRAFLIAALAATSCTHITCAKDSATPLAAVQAADDSRVAAMLAGSREQLNTVFSKDLHYAHSTGVVDTKTSFIEVLAGGKTKYLGIDYEKREFSFPVPGLALMTGRAHVRARTSEASMDSVLSFLAVWRLEDGQWRFLAWQSCKIPPVTPP